jgi:hypothetical protein
LTAINQVGNSLTGLTGTGAFVGANTPTLITPVLGAATATSINFGGSTLSSYVEGVWTPVDASGAALSFTASGSYRRIGGIVIATCSVAYPVTADGSAAVIGNLPITTSGGGTLGGSVASSTVATLAYAITNAVATTFSLLDATAGAITNATMSGSTNNFVIIYAV